MQINQPDPHPLFSPFLTPQEQAALAALTDADSLDGEIAVLRIIIRRHLAPPHMDQGLDGGATLSVDLWKITRYVQTLCRAIKTRRMAPEKTRPEIGIPVLGALAGAENRLSFAELAAMYPPVRVGESLMDHYAARPREPCSTAP